MGGQSNIQLLPPAHHEAPRQFFSPAANPLDSKLCGKRKHDGGTFTEAATYSPRPLKILNTTSDERFVSLAPVQVPGPNRRPQVRGNTFTELKDNTTPATKISAPYINSDKHPSAVQPGLMSCPAVPSVCAFGDFRANTTRTRIWQPVKSISDKHLSAVQPGLVSCPAVPSVCAFGDLRANTTSAMTWEPVKSISDKHLPTVQLGSMPCPAVPSVCAFGDLRANTTRNRIWEPDKPSDKLPSSAESGSIPFPVVQQVGNIGRCSLGWSGVINLDEEDEMLEDISTTKISTDTRPADQLAKDSPSTIGSDSLPFPVVQQVGNIGQCSRGWSGVVNLDEEDQMLEDFPATTISITTENISLCSPGLSGVTNPYENDQMPEDTTAAKIPTEASPAADDQLLVKEPVVATNKGVSLIEHFTADQLRAHISGLKPGDGQVDHDPCQLCGVHLLRFTPIPIYCSTCEARIKHGVAYYSSPDVSLPCRFCKKCVAASKKRVIQFNGIDFVKSGLINNKNADNAAEESWVECDKCEKWQHQVCGLYNAKQDSDGNAPYTCPICCLNALGQEPAGLSTKAKGAKDLPATKLSAYVESQLLRRLKKEKHEVSNIVVREVLSVDRKLKMQDRFCTLVLGSSHAPAPELPYRSRAITVFQNIDGVDVCIFIMFVQEYGSECASKPNQRSVYISYLDSVKYFRPDVKTASGEATRTFVYHQIMISYLKYCKKRGFATCYIWSCPPNKGEDFIFNCHPIDQKTPKPEKLQQWYQAMLTKARKANVVVECTNIHDKFFAPNGHRKITAARLPYFDGAYWNLVAENLIKDIENDKSNTLSVKTLKTVLSARALKDMKCCAEPSASTIKDVLLMYRLGTLIAPTRANFIVANLRHVCAICDEVILSSTRRSAANGDKHLCEQCHHANRNSAKKLKSDVYEKYANNVPAKIEEDADAIAEHAFCENRVTFLKFCQEHNYQFDTLRRAKHSSMMLLHELFSS